MARTAQRCIMEALDRSKAATITVEFEDLQASAREMRANQAAALQRMADDAHDLDLDD